MQNLSESNLVSAALDGDVDSFGVLCRRYYARLYAIAYSVLADRHLAEDAAQEALAVACRRLRTLRRAEAFGRWVGTICRNVSRNMARQRKRERELVQGCLNETPVDEAFSISMGNKVAHPARDLEDFVRRLPGGLREVIYLRYMQDLTYAEIGEVLGISKEAVNGRLRRAKKRLMQLVTSE